MANVFISYAWEDDEHKQWVKSLADKLIENGIDATLDQYDLSLGDRLPQFMEQAITSADYVLIICTPIYKEKSDSRKGGVGYEGHIISAELFSKGNEHKFIPVIRKGTPSLSIPNCLAGKLAVDLSSSSHYKDNFNDLLTTLQGKKKKPISHRKNPSKEKAETTKDEYEPVSILGIITDEVTVPKMDGTRGSALYKIPFRLSKYPSSLWKQIFLQEWKMPPKFTPMHRWNIASVYGDEIILDGTTIEEVRDYHRETLVACVEIANQKEQEILEQERKQKEQEEKRRKKHYANIKNVSDELKF